MKRMNILFKSLLVPVLMLFVLAGCDDDDAVTTGTNDFNSYIVSVDKTIVEPGEVIVMTGKNLDQVFKVMLNNENIPVPFSATYDQLSVTVPSNAPLGDVITFNIFFSGKGLAQRALTIQSPPTMMEIVPAAAMPGDVITLRGRELHLSQQLFVNDTEVDFTVIDDRQLSFVMPEGDGGNLRVVSVTSESVSDFALLKGKELMINNYDGLATYLKGVSNNGNIDVPVTEAGDFIRGNFLTLPFIDKSSSWGGNFDINLNALGEQDIAKAALYIDVKGSKELMVAFMVQNAVNVYGQHHTVTPDWQTLVIPVTEMLEGYSTNGVAFSHAFSSIVTIKIQPPAKADAGNFGESISIDNVKFIITE